MTIEEAIAQLKMNRDLCNFNPMTGEEEPMNEDCRKSAEALDMAIKALEQQPCEDALSRPNGKTRRKERRHMTLKDFLEVDLYPEDPVVLNIYMGNGRYQTFHSYVKDFIDDNRFCDCDVKCYGVDYYYGCRCIVCDGLRTVDYGDI